MKENKIALGLDIGGTKISSGVNKSGKILEQKEIDTPYDSPQERILEVIADQVASYLTFGFDAIGIGIPGLVDPIRGIVYNLANIPSFQRVYLKDYLESKFNVPVYINNDANCFALGEYMYGPAKIHRHMIGFTLGTGIGTGIIANSSLYAGNLCGAGEWGAFPYLDKTFEDYCSNKFFQAFAGENAKITASRAERGEKAAVLLFEKFGEHLGNFINRILLAYSPEAIVIGGSIRRAYPLFSDSLQRILDTFPYKAISGSLKIYVSELEDSAILGATALTAEKALN